MEPQTNGTKVSKPLLDFHAHGAFVLDSDWYTTLQSIMNAKLSKQRFWHCYENGPIKTIQTIPIGACQVSFPLLRIRKNQDKP